MARIIRFSENKYFNIDEKMLYVNEKKSDSELTGIPFRILIYLASNSPNFVTEEQIRENCWKENLGSGSLAYHIMKLRNAIQDEKIQGSKKYVYIVENDGMYKCSFSITDNTIFETHNISHISDISVCDCTNISDKSIIAGDRIYRLSELLSSHYKETLQNIEDVNGYISPFVSRDFSDLIAYNAEKIIELDREAVINQGIDPIIYEVFLAQKVARSSEQMDFKNVLQLIHLTPDCWHIFVNSTMQIIGYWVFVSLKPDSFKIFSSGTVNESNLTVQDVCFINMPGWYKGYLLLSGTVTEHRIPSVTYTVYNSWLQALESYSNKKVFFSEITSMVASLGGISTLTNIGMEAYASYLFGGKMFRYYLIEIEKIPYLKTHFPNMIRNYIKELQRIDNL